MKNLKIVVLLLASFVLLAAIGCEPLEPGKVAEVKARAKQITEQTWTVKRIESQPSGESSTYWINFIFVGEDQDRILIRRRNDSHAAIDYFKLVEGDKVTFTYEEPVKTPRIPTPVTYLKLHVKTGLFPERPASTTQ